MIKNRTVQLIYQTVYCTIGLIAIIASFGFFDMKFNENFYVYFTNWSNYLCFLVMLVELVHTIKKKEDSYVSSLHLLKFIGLLSIFLTFLVFNFFLANDAMRDPALNYKINSISFHIILPIMYILDWFLFYKKNTTKWIYPIYSVCFPIIYIFFIYLRASWLLNFISSDDVNSFLLYPYFFLNIEKLGFSMVVKWCIMLAISFVAIGFIFVWCDKTLKMLYYKSKINEK